MADEEIPEFSTEKASRKIRIDGEVYELREMDGAAYSVWNDAKSGILAFDGKRVKSQGVGKIVPLLLSLCIYKEGSLVPAFRADDITQKFGAGMLESLYAMCVRLNKLDADSREELKNG